MSLASTTIASTKRAPTSQRRLTPRMASRKSVAMRAQTSSADRAQRLIAQLVKVARCARLANSSLAAFCADKSSLLQAVSTRRARSMIRVRRFAITLSREPIPVRRNTGAMACWMTCAIVATSGSLLMSALSLCQRPAVCRHRWDAKCRKCRLKPGWLLQATTWIAWLS